MPGAVEPDEQLDWERRTARPAGLSALAAGVLVLVGTILYPALAIGEQPTSAAEFLRVYDDPAHAYVPGILQALGYIAMTLPLYYLFRAAKARRPETLKAAKYFALIGPVLTGIALVIRQALVHQAASDFTDERLPTMPGPGSEGAAALGATMLRANERATEILDEKATPVLVVLQYVGVLSVAFALVVISLNAMRAGLLSRFMGYIGVIAGVLVVVPLFGPPVIAVFWFVTVGMLILGRWPNGRGPAWDTVEAIPWPSAVEQRAQAEAEAEAEEAEAEEAEAGAETDEPAAAPHPASRKRKRKKRR